MTRYTEVIVEECHLATAELPTLPKLSSVGGRSQRGNELFLGVLGGCVVFRVKESASWVVAR